MRLFIALEIPEVWRAAASEAREALARTAAVSLRTVDPAQMHLTLRFLGEVGEGQVEPLVAALAASVPPVDVKLELGRPGTFGPPARTQVVWLGIDGDRDGLQQLASRIEAAVRTAGLPPEERQLQPHLTLARLGRQLRPEQRRAVAEAVQRLEAPPPLPFKASEVALVRSYLGGPRPRYEVLARFGEKIVDGPDTPVLRSE